MKTAVADSTSAALPELVEVFQDPMDPRRSFQLNNRYWPGERYTLLGLLREAEALVTTGDLGGALRVLEPLRSHLHAYHTKFLQRLYRLRAFRSSFGHATGRMEVPAELIEANRYEGAGSRASYPLMKPEGFAQLIDRTAYTYRAEYGADWLKMHCSVRYARPDARQADVTSFGELSDFHNDEYKGISTIVYLTDVTCDNGAFEYIAGSHLIPRSLVVTALHQCVEFDMGLTKPEQLAALPLELRGSVAIGNFLDQDKLEIVAKHLCTLEGPVGTWVTFNGQYVLHRGGKPLTGDRVAAFFQPEGLLRHKLRSIRFRSSAVLRGALCRQS